jgi:hypothetical protein
MFQGSHNLNLFWLGRYFLHFPIEVNIEKMTIYLLKLLRQLRHRSAFRRLFSRPLKNNHVLDTGFSKHNSLFSSIEKTFPTDLFGYLKSDEGFVGQGRNISSLYLYPLRKAKRQARLARLFSSRKTPTWLKNRQTRAISEPLI